jgi:hypothetical protein
MSLKSPEWSREFTIRDFAVLDSEASRQPSGAVQRLLQVDQSSCCPRNVKAAWAKSPL